MDIRLRKKVRERSTISQSANCAKLSGPAVVTREDVAISPCPPAGGRSAMLNGAASARRAIPALDRLLKLPAIDALVARYGRASVTDTARALLAEIRGTLGSQGPAQAPVFDEERFAGDCAARLARDAEP